MKYHIFCLLPFLYACGPSEEPADLVVYNAKVYTVDTAFSTATAFAVKEGRFVAVGDEATIRSRFGAAAELDAGGKTIIPGLIDAHCHFYSLGLKQQQVNLTGTGSFEEVLDRVVEFQEAHQKDFIFGTGWDQNDWEVPAYPTKSELDVLFPDIPVALERIDGHALLVNQKALDLAGIHPETPAEGGEILQDAGQLTGILIDNPMQMVWDVMPTPDLAAAASALREAQSICLDYGLTTVNDAGLDPGTIALIDSLQRTGELSIRVYAMVSAHPEYLDYYLERPPLKTDRLTVRSFKVYADGALGSRGAVLKAPYSDQPGHFGAMVTPVDSISRLAARIVGSGYQMNTHAIGDSANAVVLRAYREVLAGQPDWRWKIEHAQIVSPEDVALFGTGIIPSIQPTHATSDMYWAEDRLGKARIPHAYAYKSLLNASGRVALGTDFPVEAVSPFLTFFAAVARQDLNGFPPDGFQYREALGREEALKGMTLWAAYSNFEEAEKGSIEVGKWADFVLLNQDLMTVPQNRLPETKAEQVYVAGERLK